MNLPFKVRVLNVFRRVWMIPFLESFLARKTPGLAPDHWICKFVPNPYQYEAGSFRIIKRRGINMQVDISDYIGHYIYFGFDDPSYHTLFSLCSQTSRVLDIGANIGWTALCLAGIASEGRVIGFEPDPVNFDRCQSNVERNDLKNIQVYSLALGDHPGSVPMEVRTPSNRGGNRIAPGVTTAGKMVEVMRLDDFLSTHPLDRVDLIKMDVEGFEVRVLRGAEKTLRLFKPTLFIEVDDNNLRDQGDSASLLVRFLEQLGYANILQAETSQPVSSGMNFGGCHFDIIAR